VNKGEQNMSSNQNRDGTQFKIGWPEKPSDWKEMPATFSEEKLEN
jgi:hypothetical protein